MFIQAPVTVDKFLGTKPLRHVISTRQGPGGKKLEYMAGEVVTQTLNDAFGYDGWSMEVKDKSREVRLNLFAAFDLLVSQD